MKYLYVLVVALMWATPETFGGEQEQKIAAECAAQGGEPVTIATCVGTNLTDVEIEKCLKGDCFGPDDELTKVWRTIFGRNGDEGQKCGNFDIHPGDEGNVGFGRSKVWRLCSGYEFVFQKDSNLVVYNKAKEPIWAAKTEGSGGVILAMQGDGNLVIYASGGTPVWSSNTYGHPGAFLAVQEDGNVVIYEPGLPPNNPIWATKTYNK